ncbi:protein MpBHLH16 [Marchantia polymorpha subsp. ruderalis]|nr:hypothetical protein MARPO_0150s0015 [Marchantia polymorpha]BBN07600.1 hypothetical protein Mp_4g04910 [Marchantia polymorpha subsp. ruderalis]|eukprot:PTQ28992.1 hypothetical protein MARPO_0150s0015 [Marchantia polymorpha]
MMTSTTRPAPGGVWMAGNSPDLRLASCIPGIENDLRWRPTNCQSPSSNDPTAMKDDLPSSSGFSAKGMLDDESWYMGPESTLLDEMKELVGSQQQQQHQHQHHHQHQHQQQDNMSSAHFNTLDAPHLHGLFNRSNVNRSFGGLSSFLDTGMQYDGGMSSIHCQGGGGPAGAAGMGGNFLQHQHQPQADGQSAVGGSSSSGVIAMPSLGPNVHSGNVRGALLSNLSPRGGLQVEGGGGGGAAFGHQGANLNKLLSTCSFTNAVGGFNNHHAHAHHSAHHGLGAAGMGSGGFGDTYNNSLSRNLMAKDNHSLQMLNVERPPYLSKHLLCSSSSAQKVAPCSTTSTSSQQHKRGGTLRHAVSGGPISPAPVDKASLRVITSASNDSSVNMPGDDRSNAGGKPDKAMVVNMCGPAPAPAPAPSSAGAKDDAKAKLGSDDGGATAGDTDMADTEPRLDQDEAKDDDDIEESGYGSGLYEADDMNGMDGQGPGTALSLHGEKGKGKKGLPAKNLMAERRRRKKLNDRLYMLRSVVPKITKMDRASILGDAIEYLKELLDRINDLHNELGSTTPLDRPPIQQQQQQNNHNNNNSSNNNNNVVNSAALQAAMPQPSSSTLTTCRVKEELPSSIPSPDSQQQPQTLRVDVNMGERRGLNIHMFCSRRPGLLLSTMRALDGLGLEVQQAVVSCFNGFALDVFRAEQLQDNEIGSEEVRSVLLHVAGANVSALQ